MSIPFHKYVGAGNDFVFLEFQSPFRSMDLSELSREMCDRHFGIGADGLVIVETLSLLDKEFKWHFFNSDGSSAEMCGNAARCAFQFIHKIHNVKSATMEALCGTLVGEALEESAKVTWQLQSADLEKKTIDIDGKAWDGFFVNTGVPHFVLLNKGDKVSKELCQKLQDHHEFAPHKTNVTLLDQSNGKNETKTFERGVCDFTLACGTGVIASSLVLQSLKEEQFYDLVAPGGELQVEINDKEVSLLGPAELVYTGEFQLRRFNV